MSENPSFILQRFLMLPLSRKEKRAQTSTFWVRRRPGGVGVFHAKWWQSKSSFPPSKVRYFSGKPSENKLCHGCAGNFAGMSRTPGVFKKFVQNVCARFLAAAELSAPQDAAFLKHLRLRWVGVCVLMVEKRL